MCGIVGILGDFPNKNLQKDSIQSMISTLAHRGPDAWGPARFMPTLAGRLFCVKDLAGPLDPECN